MRIRSWRRLIGQALVILVLAFVLYALVDLLYVCLLPLRSREELLQPIQRSEVGEWSEQPDLDFWQGRLQSGPAPISRTLALTATTESIEIGMDLWITRTHPLVYDLAGASAEENRLPLVQALFGQITIGNRELGADEISFPTWTLDPETRLFHLRVQASRAIDDYAWVWIDRGETDQAVPPDWDQVTLAFSGLRLGHIYPIPDSATRDEVKLERSSGDGVYHLSFSLEPGEAAGSEAATPSEVQRESRQRFLQRLGDLIDVPLVSQMLYSLIPVLPLLIFLVQVSRYAGEKPPFVATLVTAVVSLLLFHFILYFLVGSSSLARNSPLVADLSEGLSRLIEPYFPPRLRPLLGSGPTRLAVVVLGIVVPALLVQRAGAAHPRASRLAARGIRLLVVLLLLAGIVLPVVYLIGLFDWNWSVLPSIPIWVPVLCFSSLLTLAIWRLLDALYRRVALQSPRPGVTLLAAGLVVAMGAIHGYALGAFGSGTWQAWLWLALAVVLGVSLQLALIKTLATPARQIAPDLAIPRRVTWLGFLFLVILAVPMARLVNPTSAIAYYNNVATLANYLDDWILFAWLVGVLYLLCRAGREGQEIDAFTRMVGVLGASSLLFSVTSRWLYIPVTFFLGWLVLERWFVQPATQWRRVQPYFERVFEARLALLDQIMDLNAVEGAYKQFRKRMGEKLSSGEVDFEAYDEQLTKRRAELDTMRDGAKIQDRPIKGLALAFGPYRSAWKNGLHGARYALLFAVPWLLLYLRDFLTGSMPQQTYPIWAFALALLTIVARWAAYGFFFGYFYPYLRGANGLQKGLGLFLCTVLPAVPIMALYRTTADAWQASLFWALQVFIHCMLLGLVAFDWSILRQGRYDWRMLFEVHGLPSVGVSVSSIVVAIGAAITTLMTSQATNLVTMALRFIIPQFPTDLPPP
ncbi:MAG: hypothetical protein PVF47_07345 [Anaerolineae bacterium]|jgi:hypothetical protein